LRCNRLVNLHATALLYINIIKVNIIKLREHCARATPNDKLMSETNIYWGDLVTYAADTDTR
jgi:hypothetical protein